MTTPWPALETELQARMEPEARKRPHVILQWIWAYMTVLTGIGVGLALIVAVMIVPVGWVCRKAWRAVK